MPTPKFESEYWKPISETRKAIIETHYHVVCSGCDPSRAPIYQGPHQGQAILETIKHNSMHSNEFAECCMRSKTAQCECGKILI